MTQNYQKIGDYISVVDNRNIDGNITNLMGISIDKCYIPSVANVIGTDLHNYKVIRKGQFACSLMQVSRDQRIPLAMFTSERPAIMSPAYVMFEVTRTDELLPEYLELWFKRAEFDREASFYAVGGVRGSLDWEDFRKMKLPVPSLPEQRKIVHDYQVITDRIELLRKRNQNIFDYSMAFFMNKFGWCLHEEMKADEGYVHLGDFIHVKHGFAFDGENFSECETNRVLVSPGNFKIGGGFQNNKPKYYSELAEYDEGYVLTTGSLVVTMTDLSKQADTLGYPAIIPKDSKILYLHNQRVGLVQMKNDILPKSFIFFLMCCANYRNYIVATASGTTVHHTAPERIENYGFILPRNIEDIKVLSRLFELYCSDCNIYNSESHLLNNLLLLVQQSAL